MLTALRQQVQSVLYAVPAKRKPALRRSDAPDVLFASDLPLIAEEGAVTAFCNDLAAIGWRTDMRNGWLVLDRPVPAPEASVPADMSGEAGCCISLLMRHADAAPAEDLIRLVVKAADAGKMPFERACRQLHEELAVRLRQHEALPGALLPYLCHACRVFNK